MDLVIIISLIGVIVWVTVLVIKRLDEYVLRKKRADKINKWELILINYFISVIVCLSGLTLALIIWKFS